ncbi:hypothetical protein EJB05_18988, partial [Eragrostis curvula]
NRDFAPQPKKAAGGWWVGLYKPSPIPLPAPSDHPVYKLSDFESLLLLLCSSLPLFPPLLLDLLPFAAPDPKGAASPDPSRPRSTLGMATFELYRRSTIGTCLTETLDDLVSSGAVSPELAIQVLVQFDKSMTEALEAQVKSKVTLKGHLHTYRFCDNVWTFILTDATFKSDEISETLSKVKIVACDSKLLQPQQ